MNISTVSSVPSYNDPAVPSRLVVPAAPKPPAPIPQAPSTGVGDTIKLSSGAQVHQLAQQGVSANVIASSTGLTVAEVDADLGIATTSTSAPVASAGGAPPASHASTSSADSKLSVQA